MAQCLTLLMRFVTRIYQYDRRIANSLHSTNGAHTSAVVQWPHVQRDQSAEQLIICMKHMRVKGTVKSSRTKSTRLSAKRPCSLPLSTSLYPRIVCNGWHR